MDRPYRFLGLPILLWIALVALVVRLGAVHFQELGTEIDGEGYWTMATNWVEGKGIVDQYGNWSFLNCGYALMLAPLYAVFGNGLFVGAYANVFLGVLSVLLCYRLGCLLGSQGVGLWAAALWAVYLPSVVYTTYLAKENLQIPLVLATVCVGVSWTKEPKRLVWAGALGVLTGMLALVSATGTIFGFAFFAYVMVKHLTFAEMVKHGALWGACVLALVGPWLMRNERVLGAHVLNTNAGLNLLLGNREAATIGYKGLEGTAFRARWLELHELGGEGELQADREARALGMAYIKEHPVESVGLWFKRLAYFWAVPKLSADNPSTVDTMMRVIWLVQYLLIVLAALASLRMTKRVLFVWSLVLLWALAHAPFFVMPRFQLVAIPLLCVLAAINWLSLERNQSLQGKLATP